MQINMNAALDVWRTESALSKKISVHGHSPYGFRLGQLLRTIGARDVEWDTFKECRLLSLRPNNP